MECAGDAGRRSVAVAPPHTLKDKEPTMAVSLKKFESMRRRGVLGASAGVFGAIAAACGPAQTAPSPTVAPGGQTTAQPTAAAARQGGTLRISTLGGLTK